MFPFGPVIEPYETENSVIPQDPLLMIEVAWSRDIDLIIGCTSDEGLIIYKPLKLRPEILNKSDLLEKVLPLDLLNGKHPEEVKDIALKCKQFYLENDTLSIENCSGFLKVINNSYLFRLV